MTDTARGAPAASAFDLLLRSDAAPHLARGWVARVDADDTVWVYARPEDAAAPVPCDRLVVAEGAPLRLGRGDVVLYLDAAGDDARGLVLGRVGVPNAAPAEVPDDLVIEAKESLTLRVGESAITLRADGKVRIEGKDLVSHARRLNRIKGGAVSIN